MALRSLHRCPALAVLLPVLAGCARPPAPPATAPLRLQETGLYADFATRTVAADVLPFTPQYPLWSDGAAKRRWIRLPPGTAIDARDPDRWRFPLGTRLWKEFAFGSRVETRYMELGQDGAWLYASYAWNQDETEAKLAPETGVRRACETGGGVHHDIPSRADCKACHQGGRSEVLGFTALQLSPLRDDLAPNAEAPGAGDLDLRALVERDLLAGLPERHLTRPPRIEADTARGRAALGYLHANCSNCHNAAGPLGASLGLSLEYLLQGDGDLPPALATALGRQSRFRPPGQDGTALRIAPGEPERSVLLARVGSRNPLVQMPPLGTHRPDPQALALLEAWIREDLAPRTASLIPDPNKE